MVAPAPFPVNDYTLLYIQRGLSSAPLTIQTPDIGPSRRFALFEGATNGERLRDYVTATLVPTLQPGDVVVLDNLRVHKVSGVHEAAGARLLFLPLRCHSTCLARGTLGGSALLPRLQPIEQAFAKLKAMLRTAAACTVTDLHHAIQHAFGCFTPQECRNYVTAAGCEDDAAVAT